MTHRNGCFEIRGVYFWTDRYGTAYIVETPYSMGEISPHFKLELDYPVGNNGFVEARIHVERTMLDGTLEKMISKFLSAKF